MKKVSNESSTDASNMGNNLNFGENYKLIDQEQIEGTPFRKVSTEAGSFIALGVKRLTDLLGKEEIDEKIAEIQKQDWKFLLSVFAVLTQETVAQLHIDMMKFNEEAEKAANEPLIWDGKTEKGVEENV